VTFEPTALAGAFVVRYAPLVDERGFFARVFDFDAFADHGLESQYPQHSVGVNVRANLVRGMHFQAGVHAEAKLVRCCVGRIFDAIVDVRVGSPTFGKWCALELSAARPEMLYVPRGFAHGYQTLSEHSEIHYLISARYEPGAARGVRWNDPDVAIAWPLADPAVSARDASLPLLSEIAVL
jgi:dTDP-4-dehydrorhamnose 3,5-epimerase